jgi:hypothetical protein
MIWKQVGAGWDLWRNGKSEVLARVRWDGRERWYAVARAGDFSLDTRKHPSKSEDEAKAVAMRWLRVRGVVG